MGGIDVCCKHQIVVWDDLLLEGQLQFGVMSVFTNNGQTIIVFRSCQEWTFVEDDFHTVIRQFVEIIKSHVESGWNMSSQGFDDNSCQGGMPLITSFWWTSDREDARDYHMPLKQMHMVFVEFQHLFWSFIL